MNRPVFSRLSGVVAVAALALAGVLVPSATASATLPGTSNGGVRILSLGDSITHGGGTGAYRDLVGQTLANAGRPVDWVGTLDAGSPTTVDRDHEGHPGWVIAGVAP